MKYAELQEKGTKIHEKDFFDQSIYLFTREFWIADGNFYVHESHSNQMRFTGKNTTYEPSIPETRYIIEEDLPKEAILKCKEYLDSSYWEDTNEA